MTLPTMKDGQVTRLAIARVARGANHYALARAIEVDAEEIVRWERGETRPTRSKLRRIALALGWPLESFYGGPLSEEHAQAALVKARRDLVESGWPGPDGDDWAVGLIR